MRRMIAVVCAVSAFLPSGAAPASAATTTVDVVDNAFKPGRVTVRAGATVVWDKDTSGVHNVSSTTRMFRSGNPTSGPFSFQRVFSAGKFPYRCDLHGAAMAGTVRVRPRVTAGPDGLPFKVRWATKATNTATAYRVQYRVGGGEWRRWVATERRARVFGRNGAPVRVRDGRRYSFRVKSRLAGNSSRFSPPARFTP